jgi:predicted GIY-YIG superfamily endonuclease
MYLVYILKSNNLTYVGMTNDFCRRLKQHNKLLKGGAKYTQKSDNWYPICIIDGFTSKSEAMKCEWKIKSKKNKLASNYKGDIGRIQYLNVLLQNNKWTSTSENISEQNLIIYIKTEYSSLLNYKNIRELYLYL